MLATLALILPLGLASAVSPVMLTQSVLLAGSAGLRSAVGYAIGAASVAGALTLVVLLFGGALSLPAEPTLDSSLDVPIGLILLSVASLIDSHGRRRRLPRSEPAERPGRRRAGSAAIAYGSFSMATNFTSLPLVLAAAKEISGAQVEIVERLALAAILISLATLPAWLPPALTRVAPRIAGRILDGLRAAIERHGRTAIVAGLVAAGLFFLIRGVLRLI